MDISELERQRDLLEARFDRLDHSGQDTTPISLELEAINAQLEAARKDS